MIAFSPVRQHPEVLSLFLKHMAGIELWVYDDNDNPESSAMLRGAADHIFPKLSDLDESGYLRREDTHLWDVAGYQRVARMKNQAIWRFLATNEDALFLVDSDVLIRPGTLEHLDEAQLPIICSVYWTRWTPDRQPLPNMWGTDPEVLKVPGHHEVGGLGACTLIRREVLEQGVRFDPQPGLEGEGEDRWFCHLARDKGFPLVMCSHLEPFHVYRDSEIPAAREWSKQTP